MMVSFAAASSFASRWAGVALFLALWEAAPRLAWIDPYFLPPFSVVVREIGRLCADGSLPVHIAVSLWCAVAGLAIALVMGVSAGFVLGRWLLRTCEVLRPVLAVLSQVNPFSLMPLFALCFGIGESAKIAVVAWVSLWPIMFYTITATRNIDPDLLRGAASLGMSGRELFLGVVVPASLPTVFTGIRVSAGLTFFILIATEMLGANAGLGYLVHTSAMKYQIASIYAGATFIVVLGFVLNRLLLCGERRLFAWQRLPAASLPTAECRRAAGAPLGKFVAVAAALFLVAVILWGGVRLHESRGGEASTPEEGKHSRHLGQSVDGE